jgi:hypothetical protein
MLLAIAVSGVYGYEQNWICIEEENEVISTAEPEATPSRETVADNGEADSSAVTVKPIEIVEQRPLDAAPPGRRWYFTRGASSGLLGKDEAARLSAVVGNPLPAWMCMVSGRVVAAGPSPMDPELQAIQVRTPTGERYELPATPGYEVGTDVFLITTKEGMRVRPVH